MTVGPSTQYGEQREIAKLSGFRRELYYLARARNLSHEGALRVSSARCCSATVGHSVTCEHSIAEDE